jgi:hypothetical protein
MNLDQELNQLDIAGTGINPAPLVDVDLDLGEEDIFLSVPGFFRHLTSYDYLDIATYSVGLVTPRLTVRRLIYHQSNLHYQTVRKLAQETRRVDRFHVKLYLGYRDERCVAAFIGSLNWITTSSVEIMVRVPRHASLRKWFEKAWESVS